MPPLCLPYASLTSPFGKRKQYGNDTEAIWKQKRRQRMGSEKTVDGATRQTLIFIRQSLTRANSVVWHS